MEIGKSVIVKSYYGVSGFWVVQTEWGGEMRSFFTEDRAAADALAEDWKVWFCS